MAEAGVKVPRINYSPGGSACDRRGRSEEKAVFLHFFTSPHR